MSRFLEKIKEYLDFMEGPLHLLFMSEAGRCEYLIFIAVHLAMVQMLAQKNGIETDLESSPCIKELANCYHSYFCEGKITEREKCHQENKILVKYLQENLQLDEISPQKLRQWKKRALEKDPIKELDKIVKKIHRGE